MVPRKDDHAAGLLKDMFPGRVLVKHDELLMYAHDMGGPPLHSPGVPRVFRAARPVPDAVFIPRKKEELFPFFEICQTYGLAVVPRGAGTSASGLVYPTVPSGSPLKGSVVVDTSAMDKILSISSSERRVVVEPGVTWKNLFAPLSREGLILRTYPSSYPRATVGGWVAGGGCGLGALKYGPAGGEVVEVEMVSPRGVHVLSGPKIGYVAGCGGATGIITRITLSVEAGEPPEPMVFFFPDTETAFLAFEELNDLDIWHAEIWNETLVRWTWEAGNMPFPAGVKGMAVLLLSITPDGEEVGMALKGRIVDRVLPYRPLIFGRDASAQVYSRLPALLGFKRKGPSLVPAQAAVPLPGVRGFLKEIGKRWGAEEVGFRGIVNKNGMVVFHGARLDDERRAAFPAAFGFSLDAADCAREWGGGVSVLSPYLKREAESALGMSRLAEVIKWKKEHDPMGIMNPGVLPREPSSRRAASFLSHTSVVSKFVDLAVGPFRGLLGVFARRDPSAERISLMNKALRKLTASHSFVRDIHEEDLFACVQCGLCEERCPSYRFSKALRDSPRGKVHLLKLTAAETPDDVLAGSGPLPEKELWKWMVCADCGFCSVVCPVGIPFYERWDIWREEMGKKGMYGSLSFDDLLSITAALCRSEGRNLHLSQEHPPRDKAEIVLFSGCRAGSEKEEEALSSAFILSSSGADWTHLGGEEPCCGFPLRAAGMLSEAERSMKRLVSLVSSRSPKLLLSPCPGCVSMFRWYEDRTRERLPFEVKHLVEVISEWEKEGRFSLLPVNEGSEMGVAGPVIYHDPCELGRLGALRGEGVFEEPRALLRAVCGEFLEFEKNRMEADCCGRPGLYSTLHPESAEAAAVRRLNAAVESGAGTIVTACPNCTHMLRKAVPLSSGKNIGVIDMVALLSKALDRK